MMTTERILTLHPDASKQGTNIERGLYDSMKRALLKAIPRREDGVPFGELTKRVRPHLPSTFPSTVSWYMTTVKLDLEARGLIERIPQSRPQRVRRT